jgi:hypothetical protein
VYEGPSTGAERIWSRDGGEFVRGIPKPKDGPDMAECVVFGVEGVKVVEEFR